ncbi:hypothetical protein [Borrelia coriaceae]|uniref:Uncharacterized protein n=1 Tax=Borrelia coriaceae ATCC 43381 TaxID=1408429 RepID=W5T2R0_9SPIR|nr:hypothetical protein [Borrelia coriaceae]AHH11611.1 hypothetical protein BCO_0900116 [Borrelia coriaceae ATCC 43381]
MDWGSGIGFSKSINDVVRLARAKKEARIREKEGRYGIEINIF